MAKINWWLRSWLIIRWSRQYMKKCTLRSSRILSLLVARSRQQPFDSYSDCFWLNLNGSGTTLSRPSRYQLAGNYCWEQTGDTYQPKRAEKRDVGQSHHFLKELSNSWIFTPIHSNNEDLHCRKATLLRTSKSYKWCIITESLCM